MTSVALAWEANLIGALILLVLLIQKELIDNTASNHLHKVGQALNIGILPLLLTFILVLIIRIVDFIR